MKKWEKGMGKRLFALLLCMALVLEPVNVHAAETERETEESVKLETEKAAAQETIAEPKVATEPETMAEPEAAAAESETEKSIPVTPVGDGSGDNIASGLYYGLSWTINADGLLTISGDGSADPEGMKGTEDWRVYKDSITSAKVTAANVTSTNSWFRECYSLQSVDFADFDTRQVTDMSYMFYDCVKLSSLDLRNLDTSKVTDMSYMFFDCPKLTSLDLSNFDTGQVENMEYMFIGCESLASLNLSKFDTSQVTNMESMFSKCSGLTDMKVGSFDTSRVTNMYCMFQDCKSLTSLDLSSFDTHQVENMAGMFYSCSGLTDLKVGGFDTSQVENMSFMFSYCSSLTSLDVSKFDTSQVTDMSYMFWGCNRLMSLDVSNFNTSQVTDMSHMFSNCSSLTSLDLSRFQTSQVTRMDNMFCACTGLTSLDLSSFDTGRVTDITVMFADCGGLVSLDLSSFDISQVENFFAEFDSCNSLSILYTPKNVTGTVDLPCTLYDSEGRAYTELPKGSSESVLLGRQCTVTFDRQGHGDAEAPKTLLYGNRVPKPTDPAAEGYKFGGWYRDDGYKLLWDFDKDMMTTDLTLYAKWMPIRGITYMDGDTPMAELTPTTYAEGEETLLPTPAEREENGKKYRLEGWYTNPGLTGEPVTSIPADATGDQKFYAKWTEVKKYTVTFDMQGHGDQTAQQTVEEGGKATKPADPTATGFTFGGWYKENTCTTAWDFATDTVNADTKIYAKWTEEAAATATYTVTFHMGGHGAQIEPVTVQEGGKVTKPADPVAEGYTFGGWYKEAAFTTAWDFANDAVTAATTIYAKWTEEKKPEEPNTDDKNTVTPVDQDDSKYQDSERKDLKKEGGAIADIKSKVYDGKPYLPVVKVTASVDGKTAVLTEGVDYRVLYKNNVNAGTGTVIVKGNNAYKGEITKEFKIEQKPIAKLKVTAGGLGRNASTKDIPVYLYDGSYQLEKGKDYTIENVAAGFTADPGNKEVTVTAAKNGNYTGSRVVKITVYDTDKVLKDSDVTIKGVPVSYNGKAWKPEVSVKFDGKELDKKDYAVKYTNNKEAGTAYVIVTGKKEYAGCVVKTFEIKPVTGGFKLKAEPKTVTYSGKLQKPKLSVVDANGKSMKLNKDYVLFYSNNLHAGKATVTIRGLGNYEGMKGTVASFTINPQKISKASVKGTAEKPVITYAKKTLKEGVDYTLTRGAEEKGKVPVILTGKGDFTDTVTKKLKL